VGDVRRVTLRGLLAQRARLVLTMLAVAMGVALTAGTLMLTDSVGREVTRLVVGSQAGVDVVVRNAEKGTGPVEAIPAGLLERIRAVRGARAAAGLVVVEKARVIGRHGQPITHRRATNVVRSYPDDPRLARSLTLQQGHPPRRPGEVVLDAATAGSDGYRLGDWLGIAGADGAVRDFRIVGVTGFAGAGGPASELDTFDTPTVALLETRTAQALFARHSTFDEVDVQAMPGVTSAALRDRVAGVLPPGRLEAVTSESLEAERIAGVQGYVRGLEALLLSFGGVALFVGSFLIWNTFNVLVASRWREVALLRLLGATRRQVLGSVLLEASVVGLVAGAAGVAGGAGAAALLRALLRALGSTLPPSGPVLAVHTVAVGLAAGTVVTVLAAVVPARPAGRVAPVDAVRRSMADPEPPAGRARMAGGLALAVLGVAAMAWALAGHQPRTGLAGIGALLTLLGVLALLRLLAAPLARGIGAPLARLAGVTGRLARDNLARSRGRTAATVAAVMVGLVLASGASVLDSSASSSIRAVVRGSSNADLYLGGGVPLAVVDRLAALPEVGAAVPLDTGHVWVPASGSPSRGSIRGSRPGCCIWRSAMAGWPAWTAAGCWSPPRWPPEGAGGSGAWRRCGSPKPARPSSSGSPGSSRGRACSAATWSCPWSCCGRASRPGAVGWARSWSARPGGSRPPGCARRSSACWHPTPASRSRTRPPTSARGARISVTSVGCWAC
jgi:putative ABC transport system permease protein